MYCTYFKSVQYHVSIHSQRIFIAYKCDKDQRWQRLSRKNFVRQNICRNSCKYNDLRQVSNQKFHIIFITIYFMNWFNYQNQNSLIIEYSWLPFRSWNDKRSYTKIACKDQNFESIFKSLKFNFGLFVGCQHNATAVATTINFKLGRRTW